MSRTWRKSPEYAHSSKTTPLQPFIQRPAAPPPLPQGAAASTGVSRDHRSRSAKAVRLAAELLEAATHLRENEAAQPRQSDRHDPPSKISIALRHLADDGRIPPELLSNVFGIARETLKTTGSNYRQPSPTTLRLAALQLRVTAYSQTQDQAANGHRLVVPDGRQNHTSLIYRRDTRVTGLRNADHRRARREARQGLANPELVEAVRSGKQRRYTDKFGDYAY